jgi:hypothetical protein
MNSGSTISMPAAPVLYQEPGEGAPQRRTRLYAWLAIGAFTVYTLSVGIYAWHARSRADAWQAAVDGRGRLDDARHAQHVFMLSARFTWLTILAGAAAVSVWSGRVVSNARSRGMRVNPRRARWMWFIPLIGIAKSINERQKAVSGTDYSTHRLRRWLVALYIGTFFHIFFMISGGAGVTTTDEALSALDRQSLFASLLFLANAITTALAADAILNTDRALTLRQRSE